LQIVHITDLHFGNHNDDLKETLKSRVSEIKPDIILVTGDLVDTPKRKLFKDARHYLNELAQCCYRRAGLNYPPLIALPGNHDFLFTGILRLPYIGTTYGKILKDVPTEHYFETEKVWIFGFDSARSRQFATGEVLRDELVRFHKRYEALKSQDPSFETEAFKIVAIHHHPLPVNWQTEWQQRWLTMINSGTFLGAMLDRKVNLILHGHEHLQGRARLTSTLGGEENTEVVVVSLGATLKRVSNPAQNWFNVISVEAPGDPRGRTVTVSSYPANQVKFGDKCIPYVVQSAETGRLRSFEKNKQAGFYYDQVASTTDLNLDGDCLRTIECIDLDILNPQSKRAKQHDLELPHTSGHISLLAVQGDPDSGLAGMHIKKNSPKPQTTAATIFYGRNLGQEKISYEYHWWCLGAFAMDSRQFRFKYADPSLLEFTHFPVTDPIKELTVVVQFPKGFVPSGRPQIRVSRIDESKSDNRQWGRATELEQQLKNAAALRYIETLRVAALRVSLPPLGYSYGIEWRVPDKGAETSDLVTSDLQARLLTALKDAPKGSFLLSLLGNLGSLAKTELVPDWTDPLGVTLMIFDHQGHQLVVAGSALVGADPPVMNDKSGIEFGYGVGIAGRVFKANEARLYVHAEEQSQTEPNYYVVLPTRKPHAVLLAIPVRSPKEPKHVYGVLNFTSPDPACPLSQALEPGSKISSTKFASFQLALDRCIYAGLNALSKQGVI
jgi:3',5'-cyclic AMP phosphodiesterase CpdA